MLRPLNRHIQIELLSSLAVIANHALNLERRSERTPRLTGPQVIEACRSAVTGNGSHGV